MKRTIKVVAAMTLALALAAMPLNACSKKSDKDSDAETTVSEQTQTQENTESTTSSQTEAREKVDTSGWKTIADAWAHKTGSMSYGCDEVYFVSMFDVDGATVYVVAQANAEVYEKLGELDPADSDYDAKLTELVNDLELITAMDVTSEKVSQDKLDAYVGKTGKDLADGEFVFVGYTVNGEDTTIATFDKSYFCYSVTFDTTVAEDQADDEGAALMDATVKSIEYIGTSAAAVDAMAVE